MKKCNIYSMQHLSKTVYTISSQEISKYPIKDPLISLMKKIYDRGNKVGCEYAHSIFDDSHKSQALRRKKNAMRAIFASEVQNIFCIKSLINDQRIHSRAA